MQLSSHKSITKGYTLIEMLIVLAMIGILLSIGYNSYFSYSKSQALTAASRNLQVDLHTAQEDAVAGNKPAACIGVLTGYGFNVTTQTTYELDAICSNGTFSVKNVTLPTDTTITASATNPIIFKPLAQGTNIPGVSITIKLNQPSTGSTRSIVIGANGNIQ